mmetsp:Transcript_35773/g.80558  ORF Transcript_35773/g.80558 Transcript_35773/m.80558 type:complete len:601 (+) Transcript_35773:92-1894(+)
MRGLALALCLGAASSFLLRPAPSARGLLGRRAAVSAAPAAAPTSGWDRAAWAKGYTTPRDELSVQLESSSLPDDLVGTYFRNGHAQFEVGSDRVMHPFDADGMVAAATFMGNGTCYFRNRFVRTRGFQDEQRAGKMLYPGQFGNARPFWDSKKTKNVANTNVIWWGGRLLALWEGGQPYKLDPLSLGTAGATDLLNVVPKDQSMSAHPRFDANSGRLVAYGYKPNPLTGTALRMFEFDADFNLMPPLKSPKGTPAKVVEATVPGVFGLFHDCVVTENFIAFTASPQGLGDLGSAGLDLLLGKKSPGESIKFDASKPAQILVFRRDGAGDPSKPYKVIDVDTHFNFHYANAFEEGGKLVMDTVRADRLELGNGAKGKKDGEPIWESVDFAEEVPASNLWRYTLDLSGDGKLVSREQLSLRALDFPVVNKRVSGKKHRFVWANCGGDGETSAPPQGIVRIDTEKGMGAEQSWFPPPHQFCGEPCFARRQSQPDASPEAQAEDDGYILTYVVDGEASSTDLVVLDASDLAKGPVARLPLGTNLPHGLHGSFAEDITPTVDELKKAKVLLKMYERKSKEWNQVDAGFSGLGIVQFFGQKGVDGR